MGVEMNDRWDDPTLVEAYKKQKRYWLAIIDAYAELVREGQQDTIAARILYRAIYPEEDSDG